ncbi:MAG TPA: helix-hairpin-helix domain-containing protein [Patescibacteria group bacterium]|nr:helix-hairpin-helix domain-containing protein [Patescibacteria group bacterium]
MEDSGSFQERLSRFVSGNVLFIGLLVLGLIFLAIGVMQIAGQKTATVKFERGEQVAGVATSVTPSGKIKVDVEGQVLKPGVYELSGDARVQDALIAAGGMGAVADRNAVNLAAKVYDGQKVYIPAKGEEVKGITGTVDMSITGIKGTTSITGNINPENAGGLVSVNSASEEQLEGLPAIGPVSAAKIINNRPYSSLDELVSKKSITQKTMDKIRDLISL